MVIVNHCYGDALGSFVSIEYIANDEEIYSIEIDWCFGRFYCEEDFDVEIGDSDEFLFTRKGFMVKIDLIHSNLLYDAFKATKGSTKALYLRSNLSLLCEIKKNGF